MATVRQLAEEFGFQPFELRAFADDMLDAVENDTDEVPEATEATIREAIAQSPAVEMGARSDVHTYNPDRDGNGVSRMWRRTINGKDFAFTVVNMPDGELRLFVRIYNGYGAGSMDIARSQQFGCAWSPYKSIIIRPAGPIGDPITVALAGSNAEQRDMVIMGMCAIVEDLDNGVRSGADAKAAALAWLANAHKSRKTNWVDRVETARCVIRDSEYINLRWTLVQFGVIALGWGCV